jgi:hypothetical protein
MCQFLTRQLVPGTKIKTALPVTDSDKEMQNKRVNIGIGSDDFHRRNVRPWNREAM